MSAWGDAATYHSPNEYRSIYSFGLLLVFPSSVENEHRTVQIYMPHRSTNDTEGLVLTRMLNNTIWNEWAPIFKGVSKAFIGLDKVDNTADSSKSVAAASKLSAARKIGNASFDGTADITLESIGASASSHTHSYLPLAGGTMTGDLKMKSGDYTATPIKLYPGDVNGAGLISQSGGLYIAGSGESAQNLYSALGLGAATEKTFIASDQDLSLVTNCQTIANRKTVVIDTAGKITAPGGFSGAHNPADLSAAVPISKGGTGATTAEAARANLGAAANTAVQTIKLNGTAQTKSGTEVNIVVATPRFIRNVTVTPASFTSLVSKITNSTIKANSLADVYFNKATKPIAAKANITVETFNGYLTLTAAKLPTANLVIETIKIVDI